MNKKKKTLTKLIIKFVVKTFHLLIGTHGVNKTN